MLVAKGLFLKNRKPLVILCYPRINYESNYRYSWIPYSLMIIADAIIQQGLVDVEIFDANGQSDDIFKNLVLREKERLISVGFSIMTGGSQINHAIELADWLCRHIPNALKIFGGPHVNVLPEQTLRHPVVDCCIVGPGQITFPSVLKAILGLHSWSSVPGCWRKLASGKVLSPSLIVPTDWKLHPILNWSRFDLSSYIRQEEAVAERTLNYISSYGCIYRCQFCYEQIYQNKYHYLSSSQVLDDFEYLQSSYDLGGIKIYDANFFVNRPRVEEFIRVCRQRPINLRWAASIHPRDILFFQKRNSNFLNELHQSGCSRLLIGAESGDDSVLKQTIRKSVTAEEIFECARMVDSSGIRGAFTFILGFPEESRKQKNNTIELAHNIFELSSLPEIRFHGFQPYPGTSLFDVALRGGYVAPNCLEGWSDCDYYENLQTPWLDEDDKAIIDRYSKKDGRRNSDAQERGVS